MEVADQVAPRTRTDTMPYADAFRPLPAGWQVENLPLPGKVPDWLRGSLYRNGSSDIAGAPLFRHLFDGPALLQRLRFEGGKVFYTSRHLASTLYRGLRGRGEIVVPAFGTPLDHPGPRPGARPPGYVPNANVHVGRIGGALVALTDGDPTPVEFDPQTLVTGAPMRFDDDLTAIPLLRSTAAHFHFDFFMDAAVNYYAERGRQGGYVIHATPRGRRRRRVIARYRTPETSAMHSFALTENYVVLLDSPMKNPEPEALLGGAPFAEALRWKSGRARAFWFSRRATARSPAPGRLMPSSPIIRRTRSKTGVTSSSIARPMTGAAFAMSFTSTRRCEPATASAAFPMIAASSNTRMRNSGAIACRPGGPMPIANSFPTAPSNSRRSTTTGATAGRPVLLTLPALRRRGTLFTVTSCASTPYFGAPEAGTSRGSTLASRSSSERVIPTIPTTAYC